MTNEFIKLNRLFTLSSAKSKGINDYDPGQIPFVTSTESNNGVVGYVEPEEDDLVFEGPAIAISGLGHATVHFSSFLPKGNGGDSLTILIPRERTLTEEALSLWDQYVVLALSLLIFIAFVKVFHSKFSVLQNNFDLDSELGQKKVSDIEKSLLDCEEEYVDLPMHGITVEDLMCFAAAFNALHKWRFSYGRKCSVSRTQDLEFPFPLPKASEVWNTESNLVSSINTLVDKKLEQKIVSDVA